MAAWLHQMWKTHFIGWWTYKKPDTEALKQTPSGLCLKTDELRATVLAPVLIVVNTSLWWPWWPHMRFKSNTRSSCVCFGFQASFCLTWPDGYRRFPCLSVCQASRLFTVVLVWEKQTVSSAVLWDCEVLFWKVFVPRLCPGVGSEPNTVQPELNLREFSPMPWFHSRF